MTISSFDPGFVAAAKQWIRFHKTAAATTVAAQPSTLLDLAGLPGAGSLAVGNTSSGVIVDDTIAGYPAIIPFGGGNVGYLTSVGFRNSVACSFALKDRIWHAGSVSMTSLATTTFSAQPSIASRLPDTDYGLTEIWIEINAAVSATATTIAVGYTNESGVGSRTTGASASLSGFATRRLLQMPLQAGDKGVQQINSVTVGGTVATTGSFNVIIARHLWGFGDVRIANSGDKHGYDRVQGPVVFDTSALWPIIWPDSTGSGAPSLDFVIANG
jgi:hypothetical protein